MGCDRFRGASRSVVCPRVVMRVLPSIVVLLTLSLFTPARGIASAADDARRAQVAAATADATQALRHDVLSTSLTPDLTVDQFLQRTDSADQLAKALRHAEQIGGTRWLDDKTCQVR